MPTHRNARFTVKRAVLLLLVVSLGGCLIVTPTPAPTPLSVLSATYATNYRANDGTSVICDNRATTLVYRFTYQGELESWTSYLEGQELGEVKGERTFDPDSENVSALEEQGFEVSYVMSPNFAPYENDTEASLSPQAIVVVPVPQPEEIGATKLYLTLVGEDGESQPYVSESIPVIINCP